MDETGFSIEMGGRQQVITCKARHIVQAPFSTNQDYVTMVECISADGNDLLPTVTLLGKIVLEDWIKRTGI